jgi:hypothetical protein
MTWDTESMKMITPFAIPIATVLVPVITGFGKFGFDQLSKKLDHERDRKAQVAHNGKIWVEKVSFISAEQPTKYSFGWFWNLALKAFFAILLILYLGASFLALKIFISGGDWRLCLVLFFIAIVLLFEATFLEHVLHKMKTAIRPIAHMEISGERKEVIHQIEACLVSLRGTLFKKDKVSNSLIYAFDGDKLSHFRIIQVTFEDSVQGHTILHVRGRRLSTDPIVLNNDSTTWDDKETCERDVTRVRDLVNLLNHTSTGTEGAKGDVGETGALTDTGLQLVPLWRKIVAWRRGSND